MVIKSAELETVIGITSAIPQNDKPEFAFAGKSNVGKSSLINALLNRKALARTSSKPGKTRTINFYNINNELYLVDLPGYGFAQVSKTEQAAWGRMIDKYLERSGQLRQVFLLIDIRHAPGENDVEMYNWIVEKGFQPVIIATKSDKIKRSQLAKQLRLIRDTLGAPAGTPVIPFSAENKSGREEILRFFEL
ncbi:MAG: YihA family ribosome biogenesis GTP-binding protein [Lachnospiraceae bacterium]|nr:YihA family ribosome biogenesis GTP-binding protein [Lachnospiraceae bacterium]